MKYIIGAIFLLLSFSVVAENNDDRNTTITSGAYLADHSICTSPKKPPRLHCEAYPDVVAAEKFFAGKHELRTTSIYTETKGQASASATYFFLSGEMQAQGSIDSVTKLRFTWKTNDGYYQISSFPLEKFRVIIDDSQTPWIEFKLLDKVNCNPWGDCYVAKASTKDDLGWIEYITLHIKSADWEMKIQLP